VSKADEFTRDQLEAVGLQVVDGTAWLGSNSGFDVWSESFRHEQVLQLARRAPNDSSFVKGEWIFLPRVMQLRAWVHNDRTRRLRAAALAGDLDRVEQFSAGLDEWTIRLADEDNPVEVVIDDLPVGQLGAGPEGGRGLVHRVALTMPVRAHGYFVWRKAGRRRITPGVCFGKPAPP